MLAEAKAENIKVFEKKTDKFTLVAKESGDKLKLFVDVIPEAGAGSITGLELVAILRELIPEDRLAKEVIEDVAKYLSIGERVENRRVAKGEAAVQGADGKLVLLVKKYTGAGELQPDSKGHVNYGDIHLFDNVRKGQAIGRIYKPKAGTDGTDVYGKKINAAAGQPLKLTLGEGLSVAGGEANDSSYEVITAENDGYITEGDGKLILNTELAIKGNLDFNFGNLDFIGSVSVSGDITQAFRIKATKGITIGGSVTSATLIAVDGDIVIKGFAHGGEGSSFQCGKNLALSVAHSVTAEVKGDINIQKEALDCMLRTQGSVHSERGHLIGGETYVGVGAEAKEFGNEAGKATKIHLCSTVETTTQYAELVINIENHEKAIKLLESHLGPFAQHPTRVERLRSPHREKMEKLLAKFKDVAASKEKLLEKKANLLQTAVMVESMQVNFSGKFHQQTMIKGRESVFLAKDTLNGPAGITYFPAEDRFEQGEVKPIISAGETK